MTAQPAARRSPETHSRTGTADFAERRVASIAVKIGGMCCAITTGAFRFEGSSGNTLANASGPPVDDPMATSCTGPPGRRIGETGGVGTVDFVTQSEPCDLGNLQSARIFGMSSRAIVSRVAFISTLLGLAT